MQALEHGIKREREGDDSKDAPVPSGGRYLKLLKFQLGIK